jgi:GAF domain-containing protein
MGAREFQQSKQAVLEIIAEMVGISVEQLASNAAQAA